MATNRKKARRLKPATPIFVSSTNRAVDSARLLNDLDRAVGAVTQRLAHELERDVPVEYLAPALELRFADQQAADVAEKQLNDAGWHGVTPGSNAGTLIIPLFAPLLR